MNRSSLKSFLIESGIISEVSADWKRDFLMGSKGMPKTTEDVLNYVADIYFTAFEGEQNVKAINKKMAKWLIEQIMALGGTTNIGTKEREKLLIVMTWLKVAGSEGNLPKMDLNSAYEFSKNKLDEKKKKDSVDNTQHPEPPITKVEEEGLVERVYVIPDGSGRVWVKVNPKKAGEFFDRLCDANKPFGVGCQSVHSGMMHSEHRNPNRTSYTLLGPESGKQVPIGTIMALSIDSQSKNMVEGKQTGNQAIGTNLYGWNDLFEKFVEFLGTPIAKATIEKTTDTYTFSYAFQNKKFDALNRLDALRPDFIENSKNVILASQGGKEWFERRNIDALKALQKFKAKGFVENIEAYVKSATFKEALIQLAPEIPNLAKKHPSLVLSKINFLLDYLPLENFKSLIQNVDLNDYIINNRSEFEKLLKKLSNVNSKDAKAFRDIFKSILEENFEIIIRSYGKGLDGVKKLMTFLEMPKSDKHQFIRKEADGKIIALKKEVKREGGVETVNDVEFELPEQLAMTPQKERRDLLKKNEDFIKSLIDGDAEKKEINFLRMLFGESNPQDIQRTLKAEKDKFIKYYDNPANITKHNMINGVPLPGIFEFYRIFGKGKLIGRGSSIEEGKEKPYYKFDLEDLRNPEIAKIVVGFFARLHKAHTGAATIDATGQYKILEDYLHMLEIAGESKERISEIISKYKPSELQFYKGKDVIIPFVVYEKYYSLLSNYTSPENALKNIKDNREDLISKMGYGEYEKLLKSHSTPAFDVDLGEMVEFLGIEEMDWVYDPKKDTNVKQKVRKDDVYLNIGRKYEVTRIVYPEDAGSILNSKIKVLDNRKQESEWMDTKLFKVGMKYLNESNEVSAFIKKKLFETYIKNKK